MLKENKRLENVNCFVDELADIEEGAIILFNSIVIGKSKIKKKAVIGPNSIVINSTIGVSSQVISSYVIDSIIGDYTSVGPFSHIRNNSFVDSNCRIGNYVEVKNSTIKNNTKASHLSYIGDAVIGENCNFGCGSITVNYDGKQKHQTRIGNDVFVGCNVNLIAPINIGDKSLIACGSTITEDVSDKSLAIARAKQINKDNYYD